MKKLSILICSLQERHNLLERLKKVLHPQITDEVELLIDIDNGEKIIGQKRQDLLSSSTGEYVCYIDDDDLVSNDYVSSILKAVENKPDCCSIRGEWHEKTSTRHIIWGKAYVGCHQRGKTFYICTNHVTPVKSSIAKQCGFPPASRGEDMEYGRRVVKLVKTENRIANVIYHYYRDINQSAVISAWKRHGL